MINYQRVVKIDKKILRDITLNQSFDHKHDTLSMLKGKWKLEKIVRSWTTNIPNKTEYFLDISDTLILYNMEINICEIYNFKITDSTIEYNHASCTLKCCDDRIDLLGGLLNYSGRYKIKDSLLTIEGDKGTYYLIKQKINNKRQ